MATNNSVNMGIQENADGGQVQLGIVQRFLKWLGANITITGSGSATVTFPSVDASLLSDAAGEFTALDEKTTLHDDDLFVIEDAEDGGTKKKVKKSNVGGGGGSSDGWTPDLNTWSYSSGVRSQAYTNDPAAGSNIQLNMADTSNFQVGSKVTVSSSAGSETVYITEVSTNTYIKVDELTLNHTTTSPLVTLIPFVFVISINADMTSVLQVKDRVSFIQDATLKFSIVHAVGSYSGGATLITIYTGETYELTTSAISTPKYSHIANPLGFPQDRDIWDYVFSCSRASSKVSPSAGTWYGGTLLSDTGSAIALPIGAWLVDYCAPIYGNKASTTQYTVKATLSTANNTEVYPDTTIIAKSGGASGTISIFLTQTREKYFSVSSPTTLYVNVATPASGGTNIGLDGISSALTIRAKNQYL